MSVVLDTVLTYLPAKGKQLLVAGLHSTPRVVITMDTQQIHVDEEASYKMTAESPITVLIVALRPAGNRGDHFHTSCVNCYNG